MFKGSKILEKNDVSFDAKSIKYFVSFRMHMTIGKNLEHVIDEQEEELQRLRDGVIELEKALNLDPLLA